jgi:hypothetical protein
MKLAFTDFWDGFQTDNNLFYYLIRDIKEDVILTSPEEADCIIYTCFGQNHNRFNDKKKIFYIAEVDEKIREKYLSFNGYDYSITVDFDTYNGRNVRIPHWMLYVDFYNIGSYNNPEYIFPKEYLIGPNKFYDIPKTKFCSTVFSSPYQVRYDIVNTLNKYKPVDCYGKIHSLKIPNGELNKMNLISEYKFNICFENTIHPGYYTEKLLQAKMSGALPLYYSDKGYVEDFNPECCLNMINFSSMEEYLEKIIEIDKDDVLYKKIIQQPLFKEMPSLDRIKNSLFNIL